MPREYDMDYILGRYASFGLCIFVLFCFTACASGTFYSEAEESFKPDSSLASIYTFRKKGDGGILVKILIDNIERTGLLPGEYHVDQISPGKHTLEFWAMVGFSYYEGNRILKEINVKAGESYYFSDGFEVIPMSSLITPYRSDQPLLEHIVVFWDEAEAINKFKAEGFRLSKTYLSPKTYKDRSIYVDYRLERWIVRHKLHRFNREKRLLEKSGNPEKLVLVEKELSALRIRWKELNDLLPFFQK